MKKINIILLVILLIIGTLCIVKTKEIKDLNNTLNNIKIVKKNEQAKENKKPKQDSKKEENNTTKVEIETEEVGNKNIEVSLNINSSRVQKEDIKNMKHIAEAFIKIHDFKNGKDLAKAFKEDFSNDTQTIFYPGLSYEEIESFVQENPVNSKSSVQVMKLAEQLYQIILYKDYGQGDNIFYTDLQYANGKIRLGKYKVFRIEK